MFGLPLVPVVILATGVFDLLIALGIHLFLSRLQRKCDEVRRKWRPTPVKILASRVVQKAGDDATLFSAEVRYEYTVDGTRYESDRISVYPKWSSSTRSPHEELVAGFVVGREASGWVNPWNPKEAVVTVTARAPQGLRLVRLLLAGAGVVTLIVGALVWIFGGGTPG